MQLVFAEGEKERIEEVHKTIRSLFEPGDVGKEFGLRIELTNPAIADVIIGNLLHQSTEDKVDLGFRVTAVEFKPLPNRELLKSKITQAVIDAIDS